MHASGGDESEGDQESNEAGRSRQHFNEINTKINMMLIHSEVPESDPVSNEDDGRGWERRTARMPRGEGREVGDEKTNKKGRGERQHTCTANNY